MDKEPVGVSRAELRNKFDETFADLPEDIPEDLETQGAPADEPVVDEPQQDPDPEDSQVVEQELEAEGQDGESDIEQRAAQAEQDAAKPKGKRDAQSRIQELVKERNAFREEIAKRDQYYASQFQAMRAQFEQQLADKEAEREFQKQQLELQRKQYELLNGDREKVEYDKLPLKDRIILEAEKKAEAKFQRLIEERTKGLESKYEALERARQEERAEAERRQRLAWMDQRSDAAAEAVLFKGWSPDVAKPLKQPMKEMLATWGGAYGQYPDEAAVEFNKFLDAYYAARLKASTKAKPVAKKSEVPPAIGSAKPSTATGQRPKQDQRKALQEKGLKRHLRDMADEIFRMG